MVDKNVTNELAKPRSNSRSATGPIEQYRTVPLVFWFGPKKIGTIKFFMKVENSTIDPFTTDLLNVPIITDVADDVDGIYRRSEPIPASAPLLTIAPIHIRYIEQDFHRGFIDMRIDFASYLSGFSGKTRSSIKRKVRKFEKTSGGSIDWSIYRTREEMKEFHEHAAKISVLTYQHKLFDAGIPSSPDFVDEMLLLADQDNVRGFILFFESRPISYLYLPINDGRLIYRYLGFDPAFAKHSPGTVLQILALEFLFGENRYRLFDFTEGEGAHKKLFSTTSRYCGNVFYVRPTFKNQAVLRLHIASRKLSNLADSLIKKSGLKERLRRALRGQITQ